MWKSSDNFKNDVQYDMAFVGAGIVGMASARELSLRHPHLKCAVLDKESYVGKYFSQVLMEPTFIYAIMLIFNK